MLAGLFVPFILQQTFYPFFRFGMFAEPIKRDIQKETFLLAGIKNDGNVAKELNAYTGIDKSNLDYLLRNYHYRNEGQQFLQKTARLMDKEAEIDTLIIFRIMPADTSIVARYPAW